MSDNNQKEQEFTTQPVKNDGTRDHTLFEAAKNKFMPHQAAPGPAHPNLAANVPEEGTKEERKKRAEELNK